MLKKVKVILDFISNNFINILFLLIGCVSLISIIEGIKNDINPLTVYGVCLLLMNLNSLFIYNGFKWYKILIRQTSVSIDYFNNKFNYYFDNQEFDKAEKVLLKLKTCTPDSFHARMFVVTSLMCLLFLVMIIAWIDIILFY